MSTTFEAPGPGRWELDRSHFPGRHDADRQWLMAESMEAGMERVMAEQGVPASDASRPLRERLHVHPAGAADRRRQATEEAAAGSGCCGWRRVFIRRSGTRTRTAAETLDERPWNEVVARWHTEMRPRLAERNQAFQAEHPADARRRPARRPRRSPARSPPGDAPSSTSGCTATTSARSPATCTPARSGACEPTVGAGRARRRLAVDVAPARAAGGAARRDRVPRRRRRRR